MVQLYNPNVVGKQIVIDVKNIESGKLKKVEDLQPFLDKIVETLKLNVVDKCSHQFEPHGATFIYLLAESHLTLHSFVDDGKISIDLFTCNLGTEFDKIKQIICDYFNIHALNINSYHFTRGD